MTQPAIVEAYRDPDIQRWHVRSMSEAEAATWALSWAARWSAESGAGWAVEADSGIVGRVGLRTDGWHDMHLHARVQPSGESSI